MLLPIVLLWGHSVFAGHVLFNGLGATLIVMILAIGTTFKECKELGKRTSGRVAKSGNGLRR